MVHESMRILKLDKRLARRRGWLEPQEFDDALEALPDVSDKVEPARVEEPEVRGETPQSAPGAPGEPEV